MQAPRTAVSCEQLVAAHGTAAALDLLHQPGPDPAVLAFWSDDQSPDQARPVLHSSPDGTDDLPIRDRLENEHLPKVGLQLLEGLRQWRHDVVVVERCLALIGLFLKYEDVAGIGNLGHLNDHLDATSQPVYGAIRESVGLELSDFDLFYAFVAGPDPMAELVATRGKPGSVYLVYSMNRVFPWYPGLHLAEALSPLGDVLAVYQK